MKRVLLTGVTGFVGANLARRLLAEGHDVHLFVSPRSRTWRIRDVLREFSIHRGDLRDAAAVRRAVRAARADWIFHLAVHGAYSWQNDLRAMAKTNILGTINLVEACLGSDFEAFINTGSSSEYGYKDHAPAEETWLEPNSYYAVTKASATLFCRHAARTANAPIATLRLYSVYGPYEDPNRFMPRLIALGLKGEYPPLASPAIARDYVYIEDVIDAYLRVAQAPVPGAVYNVGTGVQTTLRQVVQKAKRLFRYRARPAWSTMPDRQWDTNVWVADARRIQRDLGWRPRFSVSEGMRAFREWMAAGESVQARYFNGRARSVA